MPTAWVNGRFVDGSEGIAPEDLGFLQGVGAFETLGARAGDVPLFDLHLRRLAGAAQRLAIRFAPIPELRARAAEVLARNGLPDGVLRITLTAGVADAPTWCLSARAREPGRVPVQLAVSALRRSASDPTAALKTTSYAFHVLARRAARAAGADDALLLDAEGDLAETSTGNVFLFREGVWCTPRADGALVPGIARSVLLQALSERGRAAYEGKFPLEQVLESDTVVVTNAVHGPRPALVPGGPRPEDDLVAELVAMWERALAAAARGAGGGGGA